MNRYMLISSSSVFLVGSRWSVAQLGFDPRKMGIFQRLKASKVKNFQSFSCLEFWHNFMIS
jgi:hypothetical protein